MKLLIKGGTIIDPSNNINEVLDILIEDDYIIEIKKNIQSKEAKLIDASGKYVCPGFIDMHVHLREPGLEYKEDIVSGSKAAVAGGFTSICCMPNTNPVIDNGALASYVRDKGKYTGLLNIFPIGAITKGLAGKELAPIAEMQNAGCVAVSDDGNPVLAANIMRHALDYTKMLEIPVLAHSEESSLAEEGQMHEGYYSTIYGLKGIPAVAEEIIIARDILLAKLTGGHLHICHISTKGSVELIKKAKEDGVKITCEVTPHHLTLSDEIVGITYDTDTKVNPPLRSQEDIDALLQALQDGIIDCIATDHAPHHIESKDCEYNMAAFGISGLETAVAVCMDRLVHSGIIDITTLVDLFSSAPAKILSLNKGTLSLNTLADITIIDPELRKTVNTKEFYSKGKNTPFKEMELKGWPYMTIVKGRIVAQEGKLI